MIGPGYDYILTVCGFNNYFKCNSDFIQNQAKKLILLAIWAHRYPTQSRRLLQIDSRLKHVNKNALFQMTWLSVSIGSQRPLWAKLISFRAQEKVRVEAAALERKVRKPEEELTFKDIHSCLRVLCTLHCTNSYNFFY